ncbi:MAG: tetratricopeptide repeat protein, partial [Myxococcales bacterium]
MDFDPAELDGLSRDELILRARARGVERPEQMTRVELRDEIVRLSEPDLERQRRTRGWLGVARDLLASVVESGLNLPEAAATIRGEGQLHDFQGPPPVATVTLAEIYAAQGHYEQALRMLEEVIEREPEHAAALAVRERIAEERDLGPGRRRKVVETKGDPILTPQAPPVAPRPAPTEVRVAPAAPAPEAVEAASPAPVAPPPPPESPAETAASAATAAPVPAETAAPEASPAPAPAEAPAPTETAAPA